MAGSGRAPSAKAAPAGPRSGDDVQSIEQVSEIQRGRILSAMAEVASERGAGNVTVAHVVARSGVSRRTFYELFEDREDCFLSAFDVAVERIAAAVVPAYERPGKWRERIRASLVALLEALDENPAVARLLIVETLGAGQRALERRRRVLARIVVAVDEGRKEGKDGDALPSLTTEGIVGGIFSLIHSRLLEGGSGWPLELLNPLMSMIVLPYLGPAAARRELQQPAPKALNGGRRVSGDPLRELDMRLTYRTVRVLLAVGANPGASNRQVADASGIRDQGQISKLLTRLEHLGLVENIRERHAKGEPNAWALTERGGDVRGTISAQTSVLP
jgi:AcrR family transcriptional regulator